MTLYPHTELRATGTAILRAAGASTSTAAIVADHLVEAQACGVESHGLMRLPRYVKSIRGRSEEGSRSIDPAATMSIRSDRACMGIVDGGWGFGQPPACRAMTMAVEKARAFGVGAVGVVDCGHVGRLAAYTTMAVEAGCIGIAVAKTLAHMAPYGGASPILGNSPYSLAAPAETQLPIVVDFASTASARGKILNYHARGESLPEGWIIDKDGKASVDPRAFLDGGSLLPFGRHKGYGLSVMGEVLGAALLGLGALGDYEGHNSALLIAVHIDHFVPLKQFKQSVDRLVRTIKASRPAEGFSEILLPGEPEARSRDKSLREGVPVDEPLMSQIRRLAADLSAAP